MENGFIDFLVEFWAPNFVLLLLLFYFQYTTSSGECSWVAVSLGVPTQLRFPFPPLASSTQFYKKKKEQFLFSSLSVLTVKQGERSVLIELQKKKIVQKKLFNKISGDKGITSHSQVKIYLLLLSVNFLLVFIFNFETF